MANGSTAIEFRRACARLDSMNEQRKALEKA